MGAEGPAEGAGTAADLPGVVHVDGVPHRVTAPTQTFEVTGYVPDTDEKTLRFWSNAVYVLCGILALSGLVNSIQQFISKSILLGIAVLVATGAYCAVGISGAKKRIYGIMICFGGTSLIIALWTFIRILLLGLAVSDLKERSGATGCKNRITYYVGEKEYNCREVINAATMTVVFGSVDAAVYFVNVFVAFRLAGLVKPRYIVSQRFSPVAAFFAPAGATTGAQARDIARPSTVSTAHGEDDIFISNGVLRAQENAAPPSVLYGRPTESNLKFDVERQGPK